MFAEIIAKSKMFQTIKKHSKVEYQIHEYSFLKLKILYLIYFENQNVIIILSFKKSRRKSIFIENKDKRTNLE